jgi:hypothetical protein
MKILPIPVWMGGHLSVCPGSVITNGREPRSCLGRVFNFKLPRQFYLKTPKMLSIQI